MSLRSKLVLILSVVVAVYAFIQHAIQEGAFQPSFAALEERQARDDLARVVEAIHSEVDHLDGLCHDWAAWDDTYRFVDDQNQEYVQANLQDTTLENNRLCAIYVAATDGRVAARILRFDDAATEIAELPAERRASDDPLHCVDDPEARVAGLVSTSAGPLLVSARPILQSSEEGPVRGSILMARELLGQRTRELVRQTKVDFELIALEGASGLARAALDRLRGGASDALVPRDEEHLDAFGLLRDVRGEPVLLVRADLPRSVWLEGQRASTFALWSTLGAGVLLLFVVLAALQKTVVGPLSTLTQHAVAIGKGGDLSARIASARRDEIGVLSNEIDGMVAQIERSRAELVTSARLAGMSEVATGVLHDVGNALNSVNVSAEVVRRKVRELPLADVQRVADELVRRGERAGEFLASDPKGQRFPAFLALAASGLETERVAIAAEAARLFEGLDHIKALVKAQQDLAGNSEAGEEVAPGHELEAALRISRAGEGGEVEIVREIDASVTSVDVQRHRLLQILVNLLKNARQSVDEQAPAHKRIVLRVRLESDSRVAFEIEDNGVGITPEKRVAIFNQGFTTKKDGHGFGLHAAANAARAMGGALSVESQGAGHGATFRLDLPLARRARAA